MSEFDHTRLLALFDEVFANDDQYQAFKIVREFTEAGEFSGDYHQFLMYEPQEAAAPRFYNVGGPYDLVSKKAPQTAQVFQNGELILNIDYTSYVDVRTGAMDAFLLKLLESDPTDKRILYIGAGHIAVNSIATLKAIFGSVDTVDYTSRASKPDFEEKAHDIGVVALFRETPNISEYDFIFMHTNTSEPIITDSANIKEGAVITTFITSTQHGEVADDIYNHNANVVVDLTENIDHLPDLKRAVNAGKINEPISLKQLLQGKNIDSSKDYTIFRSGGTALQNFAMLKLLLEN